MLFHKSLLAELRSTTGGVLAVLITIFSTMLVIRVLGRVASGKVEGELVLPYIVFNTLSEMGSVMMIAVYIALLLVLSRWWKDSEMVIWLSSGKSLANFISPVWRFLLPVVAIVAFFSLVVGPWANYQLSAFKDTLEKRGDAQRASPGQFRESYSGQRVFFLENPDDESGKMGAVFIRSFEPNGEHVVVASRTGRMETDENGQSWLVLQRGYRSDLVPQSLESRTTAFETYRIRLDKTAPSLQPQDAVSTTPTWELWRMEGTAVKGELMLRVGIPLLTIAFGLLAIPLAVTNARSGRAANLIIALLLYLIASNFFGMSKAAVSQGRMDFALAWWLVPAVVLAMSAILLLWKMAQWPSLTDVVWRGFRKLFRKSEVRAA